MAKKLSKILKTEMKSSLPISAIAELLRKEGRGKDSVLAHITPKEAALLKARGGRGSKNPKTGLLEFDDGFDMFSSTPIADQPAQFQAPTYTPDTFSQPASGYSGQDYTSGFTQTPTFQQDYQASPYTPSFGNAADFSSVAPNQFASDPRAAVYNAYATRNDALPPDVADKAYGTTPSAVTAASIPGVETTDSGVQIANTPEAVAQLEQQQQQQAPAPAPAPASAPVASSEGGAPAPAPAPAQAKFSDAMASAGIDATKLNTADQQKLIQIQDLASRGIYTPEQVQAALTQLAGTQSFSGGLTAWLSNPGNALKLALGLGGAGMAAMSYGQAASGAKKTQAAYNAASAQQQAMGQPFAQVGGTQFAQSLQGQLDPANQQQFAAAQAQAAQAGIQGGSVGAAQQQRVLEDYRQRLLQAQQQAAMGIMGAGNQYLNQALATQLAGYGAAQGIQGQANTAIGNMAMALGKAFV